MPVPVKVSTSFLDKIGMYTGGEVSIQVDPKVVAKLIKPWPLATIFHQRNMEDELKK